ncbi:MAG: bifunctional DNA-formamidopyrimidine glycosylase/DNA-(apurinic or apyrimidinic site) lyase [Chloroflexota bacterium]
MPELPEVETIVRELRPLIVGQRVADVEIVDVRLLDREDPDAFHQQVIGRQVESIERRGKYVVLGLGGALVVLLHLRMTGRLIVNPTGAVGHVRAVFHFADGLSLVFDDRRRLGTMRLAEATDSVLARLGPDPLLEGFSPEVLGQRLAGHNIPVKAALLDQHIISGLGNMYADEALFRAGMHPLEMAGTLSADHVTRLHRAIQSVLREAIDGKGASVDSYVRPGGEPGTAHFAFKVAHRPGEACPGCGMPISRVQIRKRGAYFCPQCQRLES